MSADYAFDRIAAPLLTQPGVTSGTGFGTSPGLRVGGKVFAMLVKGELVLKLPAARAAELVESGAGDVFQVGKRQMREWVAIGEDRARDWPGLVDEALAFVRG